MENTNTASSFNLDIRDYSFPEILHLFDITEYDFSMEELKTAKKKVMMTHPDKSRLPPEYFLFYKKAFDIVLTYYKNNNKMNEVVSIENQKTNYKSVAASDAIAGGFNKSIYKKVNEMNTKEFNHTFNTLFEKNIGTTQPHNAEKNKWFQEDTPALSATVAAPGGMEKAFDNLRAEMKQKQMVLHQTTQELQSSFSGQDYYDDADGGEGATATAGTSGGYVQCDPFSKLKYDDLRKVHKDQTVFAVGERDFDNIPKHKTMNDLKQSRQTVAPLSKEHSQNILLQQEKLWKEQMAKRQHAAEMRTQENAEKNKRILASFLRIC